MDQAYKEKMVKALFPDRKKDGNKSDFGRSLLIGGSRKYPGCVKITSDFAYLSGNGYTAIAVPDSILTVTEMRANPTEIFEMIPNSEDSFLWEDSLVLELNKYDTILFGNGIRECPENLSFLLHLLENYKGTLIVDASGIDLFALADKKVLKHKRTKHLLFTPHLKEASRLLARDTLDFNVLAHAAFDFASEYDVTLLLKSSHSALIAHDGIRYSSYPMTPILSRAGSGDALAGFLAGLLAYGEKQFPFLDVVELADILFHDSALDAEKQFGIGYTSVLDAKKVLPEHLKEAPKPKEPAKEEGKPSEKTLPAKKTKVKEKKAKPLKKKKAKKMTADDMFAQFLVKDDGKKEEQDTEEAQDPEDEKKPESFELRHPKFPEY